MRVLVTGIDGCVGSALAVRMAAAGVSVAGSTRRPVPAAESGGIGGIEKIRLDLADDLSDWRPPGRFDVAYLCAAMTGLAACRDAPEMSDRINRRNTLLLARRLAEAGTFVVFLSTSLVLDGLTARAAPGSPHAPSCDYGRQKAAVELGIAELGGSGATVRLTKVVHPAMPVLSTWVTELAAGCPVMPFSDLGMAPVSVGHVVDALMGIGAVAGRTAAAGQREGGLFQISAAWDIGYADAAFHLAARLGAHPDLVRPCRSDEAGVLLVANPRYTSLDTGRLEHGCGIATPSPFDALEVLLPP